MVMIMTAILLLLGAVTGSAAPQATTLTSTPVVLPGGDSGIGFDDLGFAPGTGKLLVPGGRTGKLFLLDPKTLDVTAIGGFTAAPDYQGGHGEGVTSADEGAGFIFAADRNTGSVHVVDPSEKTIVASVPLAGQPDYVRYVAATSEVWVTEPDDQRIEILTFSKAPKPALTHAAFVPVPGGPESLVIDSTRKRGYTNLWTNSTVAVDLATRALVATWANSCIASRGIALDDQRGFLFVGCREGKAVTLDVKNGKMLGSLTAGDGVDIIAFQPSFSHLYMAGAKSATLAVLDVSPVGELSLSGIGPAATGSHCVASDVLGNIWVCDPDRGRLLLYKDPGSLWPPPRSVR